MICPVMSRPVFEDHGGDDRGATVLKVDCQRENCALWKSYVTATGEAGECGLKK